VFHEHPITWTDATVARLWNWYARTSPFRDLYFAKRFGDLILRGSGLPLAQPLTVLDFGCGPGFLWDHLRAMDARWMYVGADFSPDSTTQLAARARGDARFGGVHALSALPVPCESAAFDAAFLVEVVEHVADDYLQPTLREMHRLLKPDGRLVISTPNREDLTQSMRLCPECGAIFHEWQHVRTWDADALADYVGRFGFRPVRIAAEDFFARGIHRTVFNALRRTLRGTAKPHLLGVFVRV
jgi:SAM-dependent methyltransferase